MQFVDIFFIAFHSTWSPAQRLPDVWEVVVVDKICEPLTGLWRHSLIIDRGENLLCQQQDTSFGRVVVAYICQFLGDFLADVPVLYNDGVVVEQRPRAVVLSDGAALHPTSPSLDIRVVHGAQSRSAMRQSTRSVQPAAC